VATGFSKNIRRSQSRQTRADYDDGVRRRWRSLLLPTPKRGRDKRPGGERRQPEEAPAVDAHRDYSGHLALGSKLMIVAGGEVGIIGRSSGRPMAL